MFPMTEVGKNISIHKMDMIEHIGQGLLINNACAFKIMDKLLVLEEPRWKSVFVSSGTSGRLLLLGEGIC
ncbi:hypothetical protein ES703_70238 [subsurface metagenome]